MEGPGQGHHARMPSQQMLNFGPQAHPSGFIMSAGPPIQNRECYGCTVTLLHNTSRDHLLKSS